METIQPFFNKMWTREATSILIQQYHENECLWMTTSHLYRNKNKRVEALNKIAVEVGKYRPQTSPDDIKNKINGIRTQYVSEINKLMVAKNQGELYEPTLWCFESLAFLKPFTQPKHRPPVNWIKNGIPKTSRPTSLIKPNQHIHSQLQTQNQTQSISVTQLDQQQQQQQQSLYKQEIKEDPFMIKTESLVNMNDVEIIEDILISDDDISINCSLDDETLNLNQDQQQTSSYSRTEDSDDQQRVQKLLSSSRVNSEISLVPKKDATKRKYEELQISENNFEEKIFKNDEITVEKKDENDERINIFGKFVISQMKIITDNVLLMKLEHAIQNAIIEAQLKQIEIDEKKKFNSSINDNI